MVNVWLLAGAVFVQSLEGVRQCTMFVYLNGTNVGGFRVRRATWTG